MEFLFFTLNRVYARTRVGRINNLNVICWHAGSAREMGITESTSVNGGSSSINSNNMVFPSVETRNLKQFNFADLKAATKSFKSDALLGEGGFGKVYKGWLHEKTLTPTKAGSGMVVAVKKLNSESLQGFREWQVCLISTLIISHVVLRSHCFF